MNRVQLIFKRLKSSLPHKATADVNPCTENEEVTLNFVRLCDGWYADVPGWTGNLNQLEMVCGADDLLTYLSGDTQFVSLILSLTPREDALHLKKIRDHFGGADYAVDDNECPVKQIWLCGVNNIYWGGYSPEDIYFTLNTDHPNNAPLQ